MYATVPLGLLPVSGQRSLSSMVLMLKYLVKVYFDSFEVPALYFYCFVHSVRPQDRAREGPRMGSEINI